MKNENFSYSATYGVCVAHAAILSSVSATLPLLPVVSLLATLVLMSALNGPGSGALEATEH